MVSEVHLDLTGVGDRIAAEIKDALKGVTLKQDGCLADVGDRIAAEVKEALEGFQVAQNSALTAEDIGKSVEHAVGKYLQSIDDKISGVRGTFGELQIGASANVFTIAKDLKELSAAVKAVLPLSSPSLRHADIELDAISLREMIMTHATCIWELKTEMKMPKLHITTYPDEDGPTVYAAVVHTKYKDILLPCKEMGAGPSCGGRPPDHKHTYRQAFQTQIIRGCSESTDLRALQSLYLNSRNELADKVKSDSFVRGKKQQPFTRA
nr:hypothetical protein B0A51_07304 [Rachicladosporium sp. CCFEE 5018]